VLLLCTHVLLYIQYLAVVCVVFFFTVTLYDTVLDSSNCLFGGQVGVVSLSKVKNTVCCLSYVYATAKHNDTLKKKRNQRGPVNHLFLPLLLLSHPVVTEHRYSSQSDSTTMVSRDEKKRPRGTKFKKMQ
jgi:hypothetical protein